MYYWLKTEMGCDEYSADIAIKEVDSHISRKIYELNRKSKKDEIINNGKQNFNSVLEETTNNSYI